MTSTTSPMKNSPRTFRAFHGFARELIGVDAARGDLGFFVAFGVGGDENPVVQIAFEPIQGLVGPGGRRVEFEPALGKALWQNAEESGAGGGQVSGLGFANGRSDFAIGSQIDAQRLAFFPVGRDLQDGRAAQSAMREEHLFAKRLMIDGDATPGGDAGEVAVERFALFLRGRAGRARGAF